LGHWWPLPPCLGLPPARRRTEGRRPPCQCPPKPMPFLTIQTRVVRRSWQEETDRERSVGACTIEPTHTMHDGFNGIQPGSRSILLQYNSKIY